MGRYRARAKRLGRLLAGYVLIGLTVLSLCSGIYILAQGGRPLLTLIGLALFGSVTEIAGLLLLNWNRPF